MQQKHPQIFRGPSCQKLLFRVAMAPADAFATPSTTRSMEAESGAEATATDTPVRVPDTSGDAALAEHLQEQEAQASNPQSDRVRVREALMALASSDADLVAEELVWGPPDVTRSLARLFVNVALDRLEDTRAPDEDSSNSEDGTGPSDQPASSSQQVVPIQSPQRPTRSRRPLQCPRSSSWTAWPSRTTEWTIQRARECRWTAWQDSPVRRQPLNRRWVRL